MKNQFSREVNIRTNVIRTACRIDQTNGGVRGFKLVYEVIELLTK